MSDVKNEVGDLRNKIIGEELLHVVSLVYNGAVGVCTSARRLTQAQFSHWTSIFTCSKQKRVHDWYRY